ncbi:MAG TPA: nucleotidyltransferase family protein [Gemmatimonadaceae bacterium]|nr:nucleotidyltransferase family protein [Gemmatimonadaceae bacterium]
MRPRSPSQHSRQIKDATTPPPLSAESQVVFRTADLSCLPAEVASHARNVQDWDRVIVMSDRELASVQLARALRGAQADVPAAVVEELRRKAVTIELRMQYLSRRLQQTCGILAERGISHVLLKGAAVGALVDPTLCTRPMNDGDILVRPEDAERAAEALEAAGWFATPDEVLRGLLAGAHHLPPFLDTQMPGLRVELHVSHLPFDHPFVFDTAMLWREARPAPPPFSGTLVPSAEHLVLHAAIHFTWQHPMSFGAWRTFRVVSIMSRRPDFDWARLARLAQQTKGTTACYWTLRLGQRMAGIAVPPTVVRDLAPPTPAWLLDALERHFVAMIAVGEMPASPSLWVNRRLWFLAIRPRWSGHATTRDWDPGNRWGRAYGVVSSESAWSKYVRHVAGYRRWTAFLARTFIR